MPEQISWLIHKSKSSVNPTLPDSVYGLQITNGLPVAWKFTGGDLYVLIFLCGGGRYGCEDAEKVVYKGGIDVEEEWGEVDPADYVFHPGTFTKQISPKTFTINATTNVFTSNSHGYLDTNEVRVRASNGALPPELTQDGKYFIRDKTSNTFKLALTSGGTAIDVSTIGSGTLYVWKADAGFDDPIQGRPTYFPEINETFSNICYVEVVIRDSFSPTPSDAEPAVDDFKVFVRGRKVMDYDDEGNELGVVGYPDSANNALVALDTAIVDMKRPLSRFHWESFTGENGLRDNADTLILDSLQPDEEGDGTGLAVKLWQYSGTDVPDVSIFSTSPILSRIDANVNYALTPSNPATGVSATKFAAQWKGQIKPEYSETYTFYFTANDGVRIWVNGQLIIDYFILTSTLTRVGNIALTADTLYDIQIEFFNNLGEWAAVLEWSSSSRSRQVIPQTKLYPADAPVTRYQAHLTAPTPREAFEHFSAAIDLAVGWRWTDRKGKIELLAPDGGNPEDLYQFICDQSVDDVPSNIIKGTFKLQPLNNNRQSMQRASFRDIAETNYKETFVESVSSDLTTRLLPNNGIPNDEPRAFGPMRRHQAQNLLDYQMLTSNDPTEYVSAGSMRPASKLGKNVFIRVHYYKPNNKIISVETAMITAFSRGEKNGNVQFSAVPLSVYPAYTDNPVVDEGEGGDIYRNSEGKMNFENKYSSGFLALIEF